MMNFIESRSAEKLAILFLLLFLALCLPAGSQETGDYTRLGFESGGSVSSVNSPYFLYSNRYALLKNNNFNTWLRIHLTGEETLSDDFGFFYGIDMVDRYSDDNDVFFRKGYAGISFKNISLKGGLWEEMNGNNDSILSSGGVIWSSNARPVPQISISTNDYIPVPFSRGLAEFKGGMSHGWLGDNQFVSDLLMHHKYLYLRTGGKFPIRFEYGLQHFAQWGGVSTDPEIGRLPSDFKAFRKIFFSQGQYAYAPVEESINAIGNHLGSHNFKISYTGKIINLDLYLQTIFEDNSGQRMRNFPDGLWGLSISSGNRHFISKVLVEYLNTTDQSGTSHAHYSNGDLIIDGGNDDYFNHYIYGGWIYRGTSMGTPLITSPELVPSTSGEIFANNKVKALHLGLEGKIGKIDYRSLYTFSLNYGTNILPFEYVKEQHSFLFEAKVKDILPWDLNFSSSIFADIGELLGNNFGVMFTLSKDLNL